MSEAGEKADFTFKGTPMIWAAAEAKIALENMLGIILFDVSGEITEKGKTLATAREREATAALRAALRPGNYNSRAEMKRRQKILDALSGKLIRMSEVAPGLARRRKGR